MRARSLNCQNYFKLSENNKSVLKSSQNRDEISKFAIWFFSLKISTPGGIKFYWTIFEMNFLKKISLKISQKSNRKIEICNFEILAQNSDPGRLKILLDHF